MEKDANLTQVGRPDMPAGYGLKPVTGPADLIPFEQIDARLASAHNYWVSTTRSNGRPHAMPVWGVWFEGAFYFSTDPRSRKGRNLAASPEIVVHLESGDEVVILEGAVQPVSDPAVLAPINAAYLAKYQFPLVTDLDQPGLVYQLRPRSVLAWMESTFPQTATRWKRDD